MEQIPRNLSNPERGIRIGIGAGLLAACLGHGVGGHLAIGLFVFAWVPIVTGLAGWCPLYQLFGFSGRRH